MNCKKFKVCLVNMLIQFSVTSLCSKFSQFYFKEANLGALNQLAVSGEWECHRFILIIRVFSGLLSSP